MTAADVAHVGFGTAIGLIVFVLGLIAAGVLSLRRGASVAQGQATETYRDAAEAWEARYRALKEQIEEQTRQIQTLNAKINAGDRERELLRKEIVELRARPLELNSLVATVQKLASAVEEAVANEKRIREHAHTLTSIGAAINLKLDALLRNSGIPVPPPKPSSS